MHAKIVARFYLAAAIALASITTASAGVAEDVGKKIDQGVKKIGAELKQGWNEARKTVEGMTVQGRVYARLHWDKALTGATIDIEVRNADEVILKGSVPDAGAKAKALSLANDTVGVKTVTDQLGIAPVPATHVAPPVPAR